MRPRSRLPEASRGRRLLCAATGLAAALSAAGCGLVGDFDRVRPSLATEEANARLAREAVARSGQKPSEFPLTDDERQLRDLGRAIIAPPYDRNRWETVFREYVLQEYGLERPSPDKPAVTFDRAVYWKHLYEDERRSEVSAYAQLIADARNDVIRIEPFFANAARVSDMDRRRAAFLAQAASSNAIERTHARNRHGENTVIVALVCRALGERMSAYSYALDRMVIRAPSPMATEGERALTLLHTRIGQYCRRGSHSHVAVKG